MKILFNGLGPKDTVTTDDKIYRNGDYIELEDIHAKTYVDVGIAIEIKNKEDEKEVKVLQKLEQKNAVKRKEIEHKMKEGE